MCHPYKRRDVNLKCLKKPELSSKHFPKENTGGSCGAATWHCSASSGGDFILTRKCAGGQVCLRLSYHSKRVFAPSKFWSYHWGGGYKLDTAFTVLGSRNWIWELETRQSAPDIFRALHFLGLIFFFPLFNTDNREGKSASNHQSRA